MGVDVVDLIRRHAGVRQRLLDAADDRFAVGARSGAMKGIGELAAAGQHAEDRRAARHCRFIAFEHQRARAFRHDEAVAVLRERF